jgi:hypothetical protein
MAGQDGTVPAESGSVVLNKFGFFDFLASGGAEIPTEREQRKFPGGLAAYLYDFAKGTTRVYRYTNRKPQ